MKTQTAYEQVKAELRKIAQEIRDEELYLEIAADRIPENLEELRLDAPDYSFKNLSDWS